MANPTKVARILLIGVTGFYSVYALAAWTQGMSWQIVLFSLPVLCLWGACGLHVHARLRRQSLDVRRVRAVLAVAAAIMVGFVVALGAPLLLGLIFAGPPVLLALAYWLSPRPEISVAQIQ